MVTRNTFAVLAACGTALFSFTQANAATLTLSGTPAASINILRGLSKLCAASTGSANALKVYKQTAAVNAMSDIWTANCPAGMLTHETLGSITQVRMNAAGSDTAIVATVQAVNYLDPAAATCTALGAGSGALAFLAAGQQYSCSGGIATALSSGGIMDVEPTITQGLGMVLPVSYDSTLISATRFLQVFGVAVSADLYKALQAYQVAKSQLPASCATATAAGGVTTYTGTGNATPACQPSISRADLAALSTHSTALPKYAGANFLIGGSRTTASDLPASQAISPAVPLNSPGTFYRMKVSSGTTAGWADYFLNNPNAQNATLGGALTLLGGAGVSASGTIQAISWQTKNSQAEVIAGLNAAGYSFASLSLTNNPLGTSDTYRFVKVDNRWASEGTAGAAQTFEARAGRYDLVLEMVKYGNSQGSLNAIGIIESAVSAGEGSPGTFTILDSKYSRGGLKRNTLPYSVYVAQ